MERIGFILAGGMATRLAKLALPVPKSMVPIAGRPLIGWLALWMKAVLKQVIVIAGIDHDSLREYLNGINGVKVVGRVPQGTGSDLIWAIRNSSADSFVVCNADTINDLCLPSFLEASNQEFGKLLIALTRRADVQNAEAFSVSKDLDILLSREGSFAPPSHSENTIWRGASMGVIAGSTELLLSVANEGSSLEHDLLPALIRRHRLKAFDNGARFSLDIGTPERLNRLSTQHGEIARALEHQCNSLPCCATYPGNLTRHQVDFFRSIGFLKTDHHIPDDLVTELKRIITRDVEQKIEPLERDLSGRVRRLSFISERNPVFRRLITSSIILDPLESLLGPNIEFVINRHNHSTINAAGMDSYRLHRDVLQWTRNIVTVLVYLEDSNIDTGCTWIIPGSQYLPFVGTPNNGGTWMDEHSIYRDLINQAIPIPRHAGSITFIDSLAFHMVGRNATKKTRLSITLGYRSVDELDASPDNEYTFLVRGSRLYRGSDIGLIKDIKS